MTITADENATHIKAGNSIVVVSPGKIVERSEPDEGFITTMKIEYNRRVGRFVAAAVMVHRSESAIEVTGVLLREVRVLEMLQAGADVLTHSNWNAVDYKVPFPRATVELRSMEPHKGRATAETIEAAAFIYRAATVLNLPPLKEVAEVLEVSQSTATRFIARARAEGRLEVFDDEPS